MDKITYLTYKTLTDTPLKEEPCFESKTLAMVPKNRLFFSLGEENGWHVTGFGYISMAECIFAFSYEEELD